MTKRLVGYLAVALGTMVVVFAAGAHPVSADTEVVSSSITSEYPEGIRLKLEVKSDVEITEIELRARVGQRTIGQVDQLCKDTGASCRGLALRGPRARHQREGRAVLAHRLHRLVYAPWSDHRVQLCH